MMTFLWVEKRPRMFSRTSKFQLFKVSIIQISARLDCVENLTRQRHDRDQTENQQNAATVDSCFELVGSRQHGVAQQKVEQPARAEWSTKCTW